MLTYSVCLKIDSCQNDPKKSSTEREAEHTPLGYLWITWLYGNVVQDLRNQSTKIINYEKKEVIPLTDKETESYENQKVCYIREKNFCTDKNDENKFKIYHKVRDHCHYTGKFRGAAHNISNLRYKILKKIPIVFHNASTHDYYFIIKQLAIEFKGEFECLGENTN